MSSQDTRRNLYQQKINALIGELNGLKQQISGVEGKISRVEGSILNLPSRIAAVRQMNYQIQTNFEGDQRSAAERWANIGPAIKMEVSSGKANLRP